MFIIEDGKIVGIKDIGGADTVIPFNSGGKVRINVSVYSWAIYGGTSGSYNNPIIIEIDFKNKTITKVSSKDGSHITIGESGNGARLYMTQSTSASIVSIE